MDGMEKQHRGDRVFLTFEEAEKMLPDGEWVHTFRGGGMMMIGADWKRKDILDALKEYKPELSGEMATSMGHGLVLEDKMGYLFIATREQD
jgi:hypothetical protein